MIRKLLVWSLVNVGFGAVPLVLEMICRGLAPHPHNKIFEYVPELTFLSIMSGVGVMEEIKGVPRAHPEKDTFEAVFAFYLIATLIGAAYLGIYFASTIMFAADESGLETMFQWSRGIAIIYVILCIVAEAAYLRRVKE